MTQHGTGWATTAEDALVTEKLTPHFACKLPHTLSKWIRWSNDLRSMCAANRGLANAWWDLSWVLGKGFSESYLGGENRPGECPSDGAHQTGDICLFT